MPPRLRYMPKKKRLLRVIYARDMTHAERHAVFLSPTYYFLRADML